MSFSSLKVSLCVLYIVIETVSQSVTDYSCCCCVLLYYVHPNPVVDILYLRFVWIENWGQTSTTWTYTTPPVSQFRRCQTWKGHVSRSCLSSCSFHPYVVHPQQQQQEPSYNFLHRSLVRAVSNWREFIGGGFLYPVLCAMIGTSVLASI